MSRMLMCVSGLLMALAAGCGGSSNFGSDLPTRAGSLRQEPLNRVLRLPQDAPFSIAIAPSHQSPGIEGTAEAQSKADPQGAADAKAKVSGSGSANALFQLGHAVRNDREQPVDVTVRVRYRYAVDVDVRGEQRLPEAMVGLRLYVKDERDRMLRSIGLMQHDTDSGPIHSESENSVEVTAPLGASGSLTVFLAGQAQAVVDPSGAAECKLSISNLQMEISSATASGSAADAP